MNPDKKAYCLLTELFACPVPKALSKLLQKVMKDKLKEKYAHTFGWWKSNMESMSRVSLTTAEKIALKSKNPEEWEMNLLLKVIKYSNFEPLERYETVWCALDVLIDTRGKVFDSTATKKVPEERMKGFFTCVLNDTLSKFDLEIEVETELSAEIEEKLMSKMPTEEEGKKFHEMLLKQKDGWRDFETKLYERGKAPTLVQLRAFNSRSEKINIIQRISPKYDAFGPVLLNDKTGATVNGIWRGNLANTVDTTNAILRQWLDGQGAEVTWDKLVESLYHADLNVVAKQIDDCLI